MTAFWIVLGAVVAINLLAVFAGARHHSARPDRRRNTPPMGGNHS